MFWIRPWTCLANGRQNPLTPRPPELESPATSWSVGPSLSLPLFDGGQRRAAIDSAQAAYDGKLASYRQGVRTVVKEVELGRQVTFARAAKTTARSRRNTVIVAALIGLLIGIFAALLWEPVGRIVRKPA